MERASAGGADVEPDTDDSDEQDDGHRRTEGGTMVEDVHYFSNHRFDAKFWFVQPDAHADRPAAGDLRRDDGAGRGGKVSRKRQCMQARIL